jgi:poly(ADP-ribose) glycohydrolase
MFALRPELYPVAVLCEMMDQNEAILMKGFRRYFECKGYANTTTYDGETNVKYSKFTDEKEIIYDEKILAIDAIKYKTDDDNQFRDQSINRELRKAYTGFNAIDSSSRIISGGWGCGVYNGDFTLKVAIQWIAASMAKKELAICPFGRHDKLKKTGLIQML